MQTNQFCLSATFCIFKKAAITPSLKKYDLSLEDHENLFILSNIYIYIYIYIYISDSGSLCCFCLFWEVNNVREIFHCKMLRTWSSFPQELRDSDRVLVRALEFKMEKKKTQALLKRSKGLF